MGAQLSKLDKMLSALKSTPRTGWMLRGVHAAVAESIAEHMSESAILALLLASRLRDHGRPVDPYRAASIAAVHDLPEALVGDLVKAVSDALGKETKEAIELEALKESIGFDNTLTSLFRDYVRQDTVEARVAKLAEQLSTLLQGLRYYRQGYRDVEEIVCSMLNSINKMLASEELEPLHEVLSSVLAEASELCRSQA